jgi:hypothetical protein
LIVFGITLASLGERQMKIYPWGKLPATCKLEACHGTEPNWRSPYWLKTTPIAQQRENPAMIVDLDQPVRFSAGAGRELSRRFCAMPKRLGDLSVVRDWPQWPAFGTSAK